MQRKKLSDQVIVITGASSGIGQATARLAAQRGAQLVLVARSQEGLEEITNRIARDGGVASYVVADVSDEQAVQACAEHAIRTFGRIDTWVNNAGGSVYARIEEISTEDLRRVMDVTFWGAVYGTRAALPHLRSAKGTLINVGSIESELALPLHGIYAASKHALKAFTDVLRMELEKDGAEVAVTLVKPGSIDTPFFEHSKTYLETDPKPPPPVYAPEVVARTILECAENPVADVIVGGAGRLQVGMTKHLPRLSHRLFRAALFEAQQQPRRPGRHPDGALYEPRGTHGQERGDYSGHVMRSSVYTALSLHPGLAAASLGLALLGLTLWSRSAA